ncbi:MAG: hypothetical protein KDD41_03795 [Flavobacteriales bacterium]|nr:hypothetical protein [Flavobacteriales bacterium]
MRFHSIVLIISLGLFGSSVVLGQADRGTLDTSPQLFIITTNSGGQFIGTILKQDAREILIETKDKGQVVIPKYEVKDMHEIKAREVNGNGDYIPEEIFATRYFITTNGLPMEKGESYVLWNLYGPEIHFGVAKNFSLGLMTSWVGIPIVGSAKYTFNISEKVNFGLGTLAGFGSWAAPDFVVALPYGALTIGDRRSNINFSGGYGMAAYDGYSGGATLFSIGAIAKLGKNTSFVFDSFFYVEDNAGSSNGVYGILIPGVRVHGKNDGAFQFGFSGLYGEGQFVPVPVPMLGWFKKL